MPESFSEQLRQEADPIWEEIFRNPFLREINDASLPLEKFRYYLAQDYLYLEGFARSVALALAKAPDSDTLESLAHRVLTPVERPLHHRLMEAARTQDGRPEGSRPLTHELWPISITWYAQLPKRALEPQQLALAALPLDVSPAGRESRNTRSFRFTAYGPPSTRKGALKPAWLHGVPMWIPKLRKRGHGSASPCGAPSSPAAVTSGCFGEWPMRWRCGRYDPYAGNSSTTPSACCMSKALMTCITSM